MNDLQHTLNAIRSHLFGAILLENGILIGSYWALASYTHLRPALCLTIVLLFSILLSALVMLLSSDYVIAPLRALWQTVLHLNPGSQQPLSASTQQVKNLHLGHDLVVNLLGQIQQLANLAEGAKHKKADEPYDLSSDFIANAIPLPLVVLDAHETIIFANAAAAAYLGIASSDLAGKNVYMALDMSFPSEDTFDNWLKTAKQQYATTTKSWERVRLNVRDSHPARLFDLAAYYNRDNAQKMETMVVLFDHTKQYSQDEQAISFIALSVHELRTPLTLLRGYIEVFEEELKDTIDPELADYMHKMKATAQQLTAFVNNILNVARIDEDQLQLRLQEEDWPTILSDVVESIRLQAQVRGIELKYTIPPALPPVAVDRLSIHEVLNNLIDNAIKYSGASKEIKIESRLVADGTIETTVQDFGVGISRSIMPNLFTKFYRDHRNRAQIGGTGLGLYLSKAIIEAHGGHLWVRSQEGKGSIFGFTLQPYAQLAEELKNSDNKGIVRGTHGWIKNHSLYRR